MSRIPLALAVLMTVPLALAPSAGSTHLPVCPEVDVSAGGAGAVAIAMPPLAALTGFAPECVRMASGTEVVFASTDFLVHPVGHYGCFFHTYTPSNPLGLVQQYTFSYDGSVLSVNGVPCPERSFQGTPEAATIAYYCFNHGLMQGRFVVEAA